MLNVVAMLHITALWQMKADRSRARPSSAWPDNERKSEVSPDKQRTMPVERSCPTLNLSPA